jgi:calmodulin
MTRLVRLTRNFNTSECRSTTPSALFLINFSTVLAGYEPRRLFNVVEFLMNDKDDNGSVSVEEAMQILYLRHGRSLLDTVRNTLLQASPPSRDSRLTKLTKPTKKIVSQQLEEIFGTSDTNSMKDLSLTEFLESLNSSHVKQLRSKAAAKLFKPLPGKP